MGVVERGNQSGVLRLHEGTLVEDDCSAAVFHFELLHLGVAFSLGSVSCVSPGQVLLGRAGFTHVTNENDLGCHGLNV